MEIINNIFDRSMQACDDGNYLLAIKLGNELLTEHQSPIGYYVLGLAYALQEKWELTKENCYKVYKYLPSIPDNLNRLGIAHCFLGEYEEGINFLKMGAGLGDMNCKENLKYWSNFIK